LFSAAEPPVCSDVITTLNDPPTPSPNSIMLSFVKDSSRFSLLLFYLLIPPAFRLVPKLLSVLISTFRTLCKASCKMYRCTELHFRQGNRFFSSKNLHTHSGAHTSKDKMGTSSGNQTRVTSM